MRWVMAMAMAAMGVLAGCGQKGSYQGRAVWSVTVDGKTTNSEQIEVHALLPGSHSDLVVVNQTCDWPANAQGDGLELPPTTCISWQGGTRTELTFSGTGVLGDGERLSLALSGPITVHDADGDHDGTFTYAFEGERL